MGVLVNEEYYPLGGGQLEKIQVVKRRILKTISFRRCVKDIDNTRKLLCSLIFLAPKANYGPYSL